MPRISLTEIPKNTSLSATFEIVTPMFIGDANQQATAIRPTAIKGALRFWWRAMNGHLSSSELAKEEGRLFGSTDGAGVFSLSVTGNDKFQALTDWPPKDANNSSSYMGYGLTGDQQNPHREYIPAGVHFDVNLTFDQKATASDKQHIQKALEAFGLFGSLGSRARRGFGSVQLIKLNGTNFISMTQPQVKQWLKNNLDSTLKKQDQIAFTAFSADSFFAIPESTIANDFKATHSKLGSLYKQARALKPTKVRAVFGLPLKAVNESLRRASPVFFKVFKNPQGKHQGLVLFLPAQFHPEFTAADYQKVQPLLTSINAEKCA